MSADQEDRKILGQADTGPTAAAQARSSQAVTRGGGAAKARQVAQKLQQVACQNRGHMKRQQAPSALSARIALEKIARAERRSKELGSQKSRPVQGPETFQSSSPTAVQNPQRKGRGQRADGARRAASSGPESWAQVFDSFSNRVFNLKKRRVHRRQAMDFPINRGLLGRLRRYGPAKVYRLKGYTTVEEARRQQQRALLRWHRNRLLVWGGLAAVILIFLLIWNPIGHIREFLKNIGY